VQPFLEPGETLQVVIPAITGRNPNTLSVAAAIFGSRKRRVLVATTDQAIVVLNAHRHHRHKPTSVRNRMRRDMILGPPNFSSFSGGNSAALGAVNPGLGGRKDNCVLLGIPEPTWALHGCRAAVELADYHAPDGSRFTMPDVQLDGSGDVDPRVWW
jgi:hypothetical protein